MQNPTYWQLYKKRLCCFWVFSPRNCKSWRPYISPKIMLLFKKKIEKWPRHCYDYLNKGLGNKMDVISFYINFPIRRFFINILLIIWFALRIHFLFIELKYVHANSQVEQETLSNCKAFKQLQWVGITGSLNPTMHIFFRDDGEDSVYTCVMMLLSSIYFKIIYITILIVIHHQLVNKIVS